MDIDIHMLNEIITRESGSPEEMKKINDYHHNVSQSRVNGPHSKYPSSATENMRFYHPKKESTQTKIEIVILMCNPRQTKAAGKAASAPAPAK
ncbi:Uncharacterized protein OBRU01_00584 [Operophtera brumata]|uniref:Uncharacterized protein n=1 Tax=Operophtera brumata TaxID=104452 RepID=A0A0L7LTY0_OPEBR|nr:Uncharacterized protein OBRU01_00584 [Operophtera brumata]